MKRNLPTIPSTGLSLSGIDHETWHELRMQGIGGSEAPAVLGVSPWAGPYDVWLKKTRREDRDPDNRFMEWGRRLEPVILSAFEEKTGIRCQPTAICQHEQHKFLMATPDAFAMSDDGRFRGGIVEIKAANAFSTHKWGPSESPIYPDYYECQCRHNMAVCDLDRAYLVVLIGGNDFRWYKIKRDRQVEADMIRKLGEFWNRHILGDLPPTVDNSDACSRYFNSLHKEYVDEVVQAESKHDAVIESLRDARMRASEYNEDVDMLKNKLRQAIGPATGMMTRYGMITYKANKKGQRVLRMPRGFGDE